MFDVIVTKIKKIDNQEKLKAFADVSLFGGFMTLKGLRLVQDDHGFWIGYPQNRFEKSGQIKYSPIIEASEIANKTIKKAILEAYEKEN